MIRHVVSALRWRDLWRALWPGAQPLADLRLALATALDRPIEALWLTGAGRGALHAFVAATRRSPADVALLPGYTCVVVPNIFLHLDIPVRYVDLAPGTANPQAADWEQAITPQTRWLVLPHNFGIPSEDLVQRLAALRQRHPELLVIEDAAHAWGSCHADGSPVGRQGDAAFFSFEFSKCFSTGLGGALVVNNPALRPAVAQRLAGQHAASATSQLKAVLTLVYHLTQATWPGPLAAALTVLMRAPSRALGLVAATQAAELSGQAQPDYQLALAPRLAALALPQLARMPALLALRRAQARRLHEALAGSHWLRPLGAAGCAADLPATTALLRFPLAVARPAQREALRAGLRALGIEPGVWFDDVVHPAGSFRHGYTAGDCPEGEHLAATIVNLPLGLHASLSERQWQGLRRLAQQPPTEA